MNAALAFARSLGIPVDQVLRLDTLLLAAFILLLAGLAGLLAGRFAGRGVRTWAGGREEAGIERVSGRANRLIAAITCSFLLFVALAIVQVGFFGLLILAAGLAFCTGALLYDILRILTVRGPVALLLALIVAVVTLASTLGGLQPLMSALDNASLNIGKHHLTLLGVFNSLFIVGALWVLVKFALRVVGRSIGAAPQLDLSQRVLFQKLAGLAIIAIGVFFGIDLLGIDLTALAVFSGALGLALGFGMQKTLGNLLSGVILLMDRSIKPGDVIVVGETFGWVNKIGIRAVSVLTRDGKEYLIPNENLMTETVENWSHSSRNVRLHVEVGVSYDCDLGAAGALMLQAAKETDRVLKSPAPVVWLTGFGDSSVNHDIRVWINDAEEGIGSVKSAILTRVWELFHEHGIGIPYPQRDIHVKTLPDGMRGASGVTGAG